MLPPGVNSEITKAIIANLQIYKYAMRMYLAECKLVQSIYENYWHNLKQIAIEFFSVGMHSGEVSLEHIKNPLRHLWGKQGKSAIKVTFSH